MSSKPHRNPNTDPWAAVLALGERRFRLGIALGIAGGFFVHGAAAGHGYQLSGRMDLKAFAAMVQQSVNDRVRFSIDIEVDEPPPPPEPEPEPPPEPEAEPPPEPKPTPQAEPEVPEEEPPPPAAAEAGKVLTAEPDPNEPLDLTGDTGFVSGTGERYVGGVTAAQGKSKQAVYDRGARPDGAVGGQRDKSGSGYKGPDLSRAAEFKGSFASCGFPPEADVEQINYMQVPILVSIAADGKPKNVTVLKEVGHGFGRRAERCAMRQRYEPPLDRSGKPVAGTMRFNFTFSR